MSDQATYDVFLSHNNADKAAVEALARRLEDEAGLRPFLDRWHLIPGDPWQEDPACYLTDEEIGVSSGGERLQVTPWTRQRETA